jgi:N-acetylglucosaminyldiphosphoundecaprenol N-acetyl-beta-D-mannosaminyltransferase
MATEVVVSTGLPSPQALLMPSPQAVLTASAPAPTADATRPRLQLGGILVDHAGLRTAADRIRDFALSGTPHQVVTVNLDFLSIAARDAQFRDTLNGADLAVADGMPVVWLSRFKGEPLSERVAGVELVHESCRIAAELGKSVFLLGAAEGVGELAAERLQTMYPGLRIAGTYSPPMGPLDAAANQRIVDLIQLAAPDFLFVALGAPRQDLWIREHQPELQVTVAMGVGCTLDVLAGSIRRAPYWMQSMGLEWAFRLGQEPRRLWRRYLLRDLPLLVRLSLARDPRPAESLAVGS